MKKRIESIDGLRGLACILIAFVCHYLDAVPGSKYLHYTGHMVELFIAISGFGMAYAFKDRIKEMNFSDYFGKRYFKIMPLYWVTLICCFIVQVYAQFTLGHTVINTYKLDLLRTYLGILGIECGWFMFDNPVNGPAWAISVILLCYVVYYIICRISKSESMYFCLLMLLLFVSLSCIVKEVKIPFFHYDNCSRAYASFVIGALFYEYYIRATKKGSLLLLAMYGIFFLSYCLIMPYLLHCSIADVLGNMRITVIIFFIPFAFLLTLYLEPISRFMKTYLMQFLGKISMSIYLWHRFFKICLILFTDINKTLIGYIIYVFMVLICAAFSHFYIEKKLADLCLKMRQLLFPQPATDAKNVGNLERERERDSSCQASNNL